MEFPINSVTWITYFWTPHLFWRLKIPCKCSHSIFSIYRRIDSIYRSWVTVHYSMGIHKEISYPVFFKELILSRIIGTFCKPYSFRFPIEIFNIIFFSHINLSIYSFRIILHYRKESMRCSNRYYFKISLILKLSKCSN